MAKKEGVIKMMDLSDVYFLKNKDWYYFDKEKHKLFLTDKAPKEAIESYNEFYEKLNELYEGEEGD